LASTSLRVHQDILVSPQMLVEGDEVLLLPAMTRYEQPGGGTETTTERRIVLSPEIPGPRPGEARPEWDIFAEIGRRARPRAAPEQRPGRYQLSTRRGKQFSSMVWRERDPLTGAGRDALFLSAVDAIALAVTEGDPLVVRAEGGATVRARAHIVPIRAGNVQMFWPEANPLIAQGRRDAVSGVPDYNAVVELSVG